MNYFIITLLIIITPAISFAQCPGSPPAGIDCVEAAGNKEITAHSECRSVTNNHASGKAMMIPVNTAPEWTSFYNNPPAGAVVAACVPSDPCFGKTVGQACTGTTALYAGSYSGDQYMIMPSGCADDTTDPACGGTDTVTKTWNDGMSYWYDIPGITNHSATNAPSLTTERGDYTTPIAAAITAPLQGGIHAAAKHCFDMEYGGYTNWYLPSKSELAFIYCKSAPGSHSSSYPQEDINCGGSGPTNQLTGFAPNVYWASTERNSTTTVWQQDFSTGFQFNTVKSNAYHVRCIRKYTP